MHRTAHVISSLAFFLFTLFAAMGAAGCVRPIAVHDGARLPVPQTTSTEDLDSGFAPEVSGEIAVITFVEGDVFIDEPLASIRSPGSAAPALQPTRRAYPYSRVRSGSTIRVGDNSRTTVVGDNDRVVTGRSGSTIVVNKSTFAKGQRLPANSSRRVATSSRGNLQVNNGSVRLSEILRPSFKELNKEDYGNIPIIQAPRNSSLLTLKPVIVWTSMADAVEYVLSLSSMDPYPPITLGLDEFECIDHEMAQPGQLCTVPWPEDWPIETGNIYYLQISARKGVAAPLIASEKSRLKPLKAEDVEFLTTETAALESLDIDEATRHVLLAGLLAEYELYGDAIAAYQSALAIQPVPASTLRWATCTVWLD